MQRFLIPTLAVGVLLAGASQSQAVSVKPVNSIIIDDFSVPTSPIGFISAPAAPATATKVFQVTTPGSTTSIIGGKRTVKFNVKANPSRRTATAEVTNGSFIVDTGSRVSTVTDLIWGGTGANSLKANFKQGSIDRFQVGIASIDQNATLKFTIADTLGNVSTLSRTGLTKGAADFLFGDFTGKANLSSIRSIDLNITGPTALDYELKYVKASSVPEPLTMLGSIAAVGFGAAFRRKYQQKA